MKVYVDGNEYTEIKDTPKTMEDLIFGAKCVIVTRNKFGNPKVDVFTQAMPDVLEGWLGSSE